MSVYLHKISAKKKKKSSQKSILQEVASNDTQFFDGYLTRVLLDDHKPQVYSLYTIAVLVEVLLDECFMMKSESF